MVAPTPAAPTIVSITFDQPVYTPGATMTATITYTPGEYVLTGNVNGALGESAVAEDAFYVALVTATDSGNRTWTKISDTGSVAKFTATA